MKYKMKDLMKKTEGKTHPKGALYQGWQESPSLSMKQSIIKHNTINRDVSIDTSRFIV